jgi:hypothetical protein
MPPRNGPVTSAIARKKIRENNFFTEWRKLRTIPWKQNAYPIILVYDIVGAIASITESEMGVESEIASQSALG